MAVHVVPARIVRAANSTATSPAGQGDGGASSCEAFEDAAVRFKDRYLTQDFRQRMGATYPNLGAANQPGSLSYDVTHEAGNLGEQVAAGLLGGVAAAALLVLVAVAGRRRCGGGRAQAPPQQQAADAPSALDQA